MSKVEAIERVGANAAAEWKQDALGTVNALSYIIPKLSADDVWPYVGDPPGDKRAMGWVLQEAARRGWTESTPVHIKSTRRACNGRPIRVWKSLLYEHPSS